VPYKTCSPASAGAVGSSRKALAVKADQLAIPQIAQANSAV
jgi:hypothetical protein